MKWETPEFAARDDMTNGWAVVTGASSGIGLEFARELARHGHPVLAVARRRERLETLARQAAAQAGRIEPLTADLSTGQGLTSVVRRIEELNKVELLINNTGIANAGDFLEASLDREFTTIRVNIDAVISLTHNVLRGMVQRRSGAVINIASVVAFQPFPHFVVYAATHHCLHHLILSSQLVPVGHACRCRESYRCQRAAA